jgi:Zn-dependent peptidase ImmA (M78 family)
MKLPDKIYVLGQPIKIREIPNLKDKEGNHVDGLYHSEKGLIEIDKRLKGKCRAFAFLHEYGHAVMDIIGAHNCALSPDLEEILVDNIARSISDNFILRLRK